MGEHTVKRHFNFNFLFVVIASLFLGVFVQLLFSPQNISGFNVIETAIVLGLLVLPVIFIGIKNVTEEKIVLILFVTAVVLRIGYALATKSTVRQHDVYDTNGHFDYIYGILQNFKLPETNKWQYYHPPLHHILSAIFLKPFYLLGITDKYALGEILQTLTAVFSSLMLWVFYKILDITCIKSKAKIIVFSVLCFHPTFILLSGSLNNDCLSILLIICSIYLTLRWNENPTIKNAVLLSISLGLSVMTKTSALVVLPAVAYIFVYKIYSLKKAKFAVKDIIIQGLLFCLIFFPLALAYLIRNYINFQQPFLYVAEMNTNSPQYCGDVPVWERLGLTANGWGSLFCSPFVDYNIPAYIIKCSVFGEWSYATVLIPYFVLALNIVLIIISLICMINAFVKRYFRCEIRIFIFLVWLFQIISFLVANFKYPFGCTMDFRYMVPTILTGCLFIGINLQNIKANSVKTLIKVVCVLFSFVSLIFCCNI